MALALRITPKERCLATLDSISDWFYSEFGPNITGQELSTKKVLHYHLLLRIDVAEFGEITAKKIENKIKIPFKKEFGDCEIWAQLSKNEENCASYTVKDGLYTSRGYSEEDLEKYVNNSFQKLNYGSALKQLNRRYTHEDISIKEFSNAYVQLHIDHDRPINNRKLVDYLKTKEAQKDLGYANRLKIKIFSSFIKDGL